MGLGQFLHGIGLGEEWEGAKENPGKLIGGAVGSLGGPAGMFWGSKIGGMFDKTKKPTITATPEQKAAYERETALRQEAIRQARGMGGAAARGAAQQGALAYGGVTGAPAGGGRLAGLRDVGQGAEAARQQAAIEATIFEQEASPEAARQKKMAWLTQQIESLRAAGRLTPNAIQGLMPMAGGDPQVVDFLQAQAEQAPGEATLGRDIANIGKYLVA